MRRESEMEFVCVECEEIRLMEKRIVCKNCGAAFEETMPKCPYCNYINEIGAEQQYMEELEDLKEDLEELSEVPEEVCKKEITTNVKKIVVIALIAVVLLGVFVGIHFLIEYHYEKEYHAVDMKEQILWENENYPKLDALYEAGDYEAVLEIQDRAYEEGYNLWSWEHYYFMSAYNGYSLCMDRKEVLRDESLANKGTAEYVLGEVMYALYFRSRDMYSEEEWEIIAGWRQDYEEVLYEYMKFTKEEAEELYHKINDDGFINYKECDKYADKIWKRFIE